VIYVAACIIIGVALYFFFTGGQTIPTDPMDGNTQGSPL